MHPDSASQKSLLGDQKNVWAPLETTPSMSSQPLRCTLRHDMGYIYVQQFWP